MSVDEQSRLNELQLQILGVEERLQELSSRLDNGMRNLVTLAQAARQLTSRLEALTARLDTLGGSIAAVSRNSDLALEVSQSADARLQELEGKQFAEEVDIISLEQRLAALERGLADLALQQEQARGAPQPEQVSSKQPLKGPAAGKANAARRQRVDAEPVEESAEEQSLEPLRRSARLIKGGDFAGAISELEKARSISSNPKVEQALALARKMLQEQQSPRG